MVERLKEAIEKARLQRVNAQPAPSQGMAQTATEADEPLGLWATLPLNPPPPNVLANGRIVTLDKTNVAHVAFDVMRARILKACRDNNWTRIGITSPTKGCGKSLVSANLAFSVARHLDIRVLLADLDFRAPSVIAMLRQPQVASLDAHLRGAEPLEACLARVHERMIVAGAHDTVRQSAELLQKASTTDVLAKMGATLRPSLTIYDLPPVLVGDDVLCCLDNIDAVVIVAAAGKTHARDVRECVRLIEGSAAFMGLVLNKTEGDIKEYYADSGVTVPV